MWKKLCISSASLAHGANLPGQDVNTVGDVLFQTQENKGAEAAQGPAKLTEPLGLVNMGGIQRLVTQDQYRQYYPGNSLEFDKAWEHAVHRATQNDEDLPLKLVGDWVRKAGIRNNHHGVIRELVRLAPSVNHLFHAKFDAANAAAALAAAAAAAAAVAAQPAQSADADVQAALDGKAVATEKGNTNDLWQCTGNPRGSIKAILRRGEEIDNHDAEWSLDKRMQEATRAFIHKTLSPRLLNKMEGENLVSGICQTCRRVTTKRNIVDQLEKDFTLRRLVNWAEGGKRAYQRSELNERGEDVAQVEPTNPDNNPMNQVMPWYSDVGWYGVHVTELSFRHQDCTRFKRILGFKEWPTTVAVTFFIMVMCVAIIVGYFNFKRVEA